MSKQRNYIQYLLLQISFKTNLVHVTTLPVSYHHLSAPIFSNNLNEGFLIAHYCSSTLASRSQGKGDLVRPDEYALASTLKAAPFKSPNHGKHIHAAVIKLGFCRFTILMTALIDYSLKCGNLEEARRMFNEMARRDVVSWTSMIVGYAQHQHYAESLNLFRMMIEADTVPNGYSFSGALSACSGLQASRLGQQMHAHMLTAGVLGANLVLQNNLLNMYWRCQCVSYARRLFDSMTTKGNIAWNEMMSGYLQCGQGEEALKLFAFLVFEGLKPDNFSYAICADVCASLPSMQQGSQIHSRIVKSGFQSDLVIGNALINMYAKCGCIDSAKLVFDLMPSRDNLLWTSMISAFGKNGQVTEVLTMFEQMYGSGIEPDGITYLAVLSACSHRGLVIRGWQYFQLMTKDNLFPAGPEHYACMVDLLCRSGYLLEALDFIKQMPLNPSIRVWSTFLNSCRLCGNIELAQFAAGQLHRLDPENPSNFVVLSNIFAAEHNWSETEKIREKIKSNHVKKEPGCSWVELKSGIHVFLTADKLHPEMGKILLTLEGLMSLCRKENGYSLENYFKETTNNLIS